MSKYGFDEQRLQKRQNLLTEGVEPYPYEFPKKHDISVVLNLAAEQETQDQVLQIDTAIAGRIWSRREMGKAVFLDLKDSTGKIQLYCNQKQLNTTDWQSLAYLEVGDLIGVQGEVFRTQKNELSLRVKQLQVLAKTVFPIPFGKETDDRVFYRLSDPESKYRERYLHWLLDETDRRRIEKRAAIISAVRRHMEDDGFLEVSTPTLEFVYGGAEARPFKTSIWALSNKELFLRISPELYLKRYIVAGYEKVFTICQNFRNEGIDKSHNPEFTMMEWYEAYTDYEFQMRRFENLVSQVCLDICGSMIISYQGQEVDFTPPWDRLTIIDALKRYADLSVSEMSTAELISELEKRENKPYSSLTWGLAVARLFEICCEEHLIQPVFIMDHPVDISPLTKTKRGDSRLVERFEPFVCGMELGNAYSELTDPVLQLERLMRQREAHQEEQGYENHPVDADFVKAVACGMPPTGGVGIGIDRLVMLLTDAASIRDIIPFPMVKPKE